MLPYHKDALSTIRSYFEPLPEVEAVYLAGSLAHGYATDTSDVDILIVVTNEDYEARKGRGELLFYNQDMVSREGCYVDGKYVCRRLIVQVVEKGNEPTRFAYKNLSPIFCRDPELNALILAAGRYPQGNQERNSRKFYSHMRAWMWFFHEARKKENLYLETFAVSQFILYASRAVLAANGRLYPFHKWLLAEVARCESKPQEFVERFDVLMRERSADLMEQLCADVKALRDWGVDDWDWPNDFYEDVESVWMRHEPHIGDW